MLYEQNHYAIRNASHVRITRDGELMLFNQRKLSILYVMRDRSSRTIREIINQLNAKSWLRDVTENAIYMACMRYTKWGDLKCIHSVPIQYEITRKGLEKLKWFLS